MRCYALSGWNTVVFKDTAARYKFAKGTGALVEAIVHDGDFDVIINAQATTITQSPEGVMVKTSDGGTSITVAPESSRFPMNVMNTVEFNPPLAAIKREAAEIKHAGGGSKVFLRGQG